MSVSTRRPIWLYPLFQIPIMALITCLILALLGWLLSWGRPPVGVAIALDLSDSTRGTVREQEIVAVEAYLDKNQALKNPNQVQVFGFANKTRALTTLQTDSDQIKRELQQALVAPRLFQEIGGGTNINEAIKEGTKSLADLEKVCREMLVVTDGEADVDEAVINEAINQGVKINAVIISNQISTEIQQAVKATKGLYLNGAIENLSSLFSDTLFVRFNSNIKWVAFWLGGAFIAFMWAFILPFDRWILQGIFKLNMTLSGQIALAHAIFWSVLTIIMVTQVWGLPLPGDVAC